MDKQLNHTTWSKLISRQCHVYTSTQWPVRYSLHPQSEMDKNLTSNWSDQNKDLNYLACIWIKQHLRNEARGFLFAMLNLLTQLIIVNILDQLSGSKATRVLLPYRCYKPDHLQNKPLSRSLIWGPLEAPPYTQTCRTLEVVPKSVATSDTCWASSLVGTNTKH